jgi:DNA-binding MarR family transcriptional regulator
MIKKRGTKISRSLLLLLDQAVEPIDVATLAFRVKKFSRHLFAEEQQFTRGQVKRALAHLSKSGFVTITTNDKLHDHATLTELGKKRAAAQIIDMLVTRKPKHWDGKWRMIVFDIPEAKRKGRDALRHKLKDLKFFKLQESVWIYPYECRQAIQYLADYYDVKPHVHFAIVDVFDQEEEARNYYGIKEGALPYEGEDTLVSLDLQHKGLTLE